MLHESVLSAVDQSVRGRIIISVPDETHVLPETLALPGVELLIAPIGSCAQRNAAFGRVSDRSGVVFFFDDDVEIEAHYVQNMLRLFEQHPAVSLASGVNVGLGAAPGSLTRLVAKDLIKARSAGPQRSGFRLARTAMGSRLAVRASLLDSVQFDERLPLYGYLEDYDFSLQCRKFGEVVVNDECFMVHIETSVGRVGTRRRGYSEVVNPIYIYSKKTGAEVGRTLAGALKKTLQNSLRCANPNDRQQFVGNLIGWSRVITGRIDPGYMLKL